MPYYNYLTSKSVLPVLNHRTALQKTYYYRLLPLLSFLLLYYTSSTLMEDPNPRNTVLKVTILFLVMYMFILGMFSPPWHQPVSLRTPGHYFSTSLVSRWLYTAIFFLNIFLHIYTAKEPAKGTTKQKESLQYAAPVWRTCLIYVHNIL